MLPQPMGRNPTVRRVPNAASISENQRLRRLMAYAELLGHGVRHITMLDYLNHVNGPARVPIGEPEYLADHSR